MVAANCTTIRHTDRSLTYQHACQLAENLRRGFSGNRVILDLSAVDDANTGAFAKLIQVRGILLRAGQDLALFGVHGRVQSLHGLCRLERLLPCVAGPREALCPHSECEN